MKKKSGLLSEMKNAVSTLNAQAGSGKNVPFPAPGSRKKGVSFPAAAFPGEVSTLSAAAFPGNGSSLPVSIFSGNGANISDPAFSGEGTSRPGSLVSPDSEGRFDDDLPSGQGEGFDPCHEDQLQPMNPPENARKPGFHQVSPGPGHLCVSEDPSSAEPEDPSQSRPAGLNLSFTGDDLVRGFIMGEILRPRR